MPQNENLPNKTVDLQITWWAEDGSERKGRVSLAPGASPETAAALAAMMRLADAAASEEKSPQPPDASWFDSAYSTA